MYHNNTAYTVAFYDDNEGLNERDYIGHQSPLGLNQWHLVGFTYNNSTKTSTVFLDGEESNTTSVLTNGINWDGAPDFNLGGGPIFDYETHKSGPAAFWNRVLSTVELDALFNSGKAKTYAELTAAEKAGLVSYWNMDEVSGNRADSYDSNDLSDVNTVGSATAVAGAMHNAAASFVAAGSEYLSLNTDRKSTRLNSSHGYISHAVFCLKKKQP